MAAEQLHYPNPSHSQSDPQPQAKHSHSSDYAKLHSYDVASSQTATQDHFHCVADAHLPISGDVATKMPKDSNPYVSPAPAPTSSAKS